MEDPKQRKKKQGTEKEKVEVTAPKIPKKKATKKKKEQSSEEDPLTEDEKEIDKRLAAAEKERRKFEGKELEENQEKQEKELDTFIGAESERIWTALQSNDEAQYKLMGIDKEGAEKMKSLGKDKVKAQLYSHIRTIWESQDKILPKKKDKGSLLGTICCWSFMILFFVFMVFSKMNEETMSLLGMSGDSKFVVN